MTTDKIFEQHPEKKSFTDNPLAEIASKFGGKFWQQTQKEIQRSREIDKEELKDLNLGSSAETALSQSSMRGSEEFTAILEKLANG